LTAKAKTKGLCVPATLELLENLQKSNVKLTHCANYRWNKEW